jgi:hypothetical protein
MVLFLHPLHPHEPPFILDAGIKSRKNAINSVLPKNGNVVIFDDSIIATDTLVKDLYKHYDFKITHSAGTLVDPVACLTFLLTLSMDSLRLYTCSVTATS